MAMMMSLSASVQVGLGDIVTSSAELSERQSTTDRMTCLRSCSLTSDLIFYQSTLNLLTQKDLAENIINCNPPHHERRLHTRPLCAYDPIIMLDRS
jgi:hypothetical protein